MSMCVAEEQAYVMLALNFLSCCDIDIIIKCATGFNLVW